MKRHLNITQAAWLSQQKNAPSAKKVGILQAAGAVRGARGDDKASSVARKGCCGAAPAGFVADSTELSQQSCDIILRVASVEMAAVVALCLAACQPAGPSQVQRVDPPQQGVILATGVDITSTAHAGGERVGRGDKAGPRRQQRNWRWNVTSGGPTIVVVPPAVKAHPYLQQGQHNDL